MSVGREGRGRGEGVEREWGGSGEGVGREWGGSGEGVRREGGARGRGLCRLCYYVPDIQISAQSDFTNTSQASWE